MLIGVPFVRAYKFSQTDLSLRIEQLSVDPCCECVWVEQLHFFLALLGTHDDIFSVVGHVYTTGEVAESYMLFL